MPLVPPFSGACISIMITDSSLFHYSHWALAPCDSSTSLATDVPLVMPAKRLVSARGRLTLRKLNLDATSTPSVPFEVVIPETTVPESWDRTSLFEAASPNRIICHAARFKTIVLQHIINKIPHDVLALPPNTRQPGPSPGSCATVLHHPQSSSGDPPL